MTDLPTGLGPNAFGKEIDSLEEKNPNPFLEGVATASPEQDIAKPETSITANDVEAIDTQNSKDDQEPIEKKAPEQNKAEEPEIKIVREIPATVAPETKTEVVVATPEQKKHNAEYFLGITPSTEQVGELQDLVGDIFEESAEKVA